MPVVKPCGTEKVILFVTTETPVAGTNSIVLPGIITSIKLTLKILLLTNLSVSAVNSTRIPLANSIPSMLYPRLPSIVENTSVVNVSITSTFAFA